MTQTETGNMVGQQTAGGPTSSREENASATEGHDIKELLREDFSDIKQVAKDETAEMTEAAKQTVSAQKNFAARHVGNLAAAIKKMGTELEASEEPDIGRYARRMGDSVEHFAREIKDREIGEVASLAGDFGRRQPIAFLSMAALAGFAASRFLGASAERTHGKTTRESASMESNTSLASPSDYSLEDGYNG